MSQDVGGNSGVGLDRFHCTNVSKNKFPTRIDSNRTCYVIIFILIEQFTKASMMLNINQSINQSKPSRNRNLWSLCSNQLEDMYLKILFVCFFQFTSCTASRASSIASCLGINIDQWNLASFQDTFMQSIDQSKKTIHS